MAAWAGRTAFYMSDIKNLPPKMWKNIMVAAVKNVEEKKGAFSRPILLVQVAKIPLRHQIVASDADESD